MWRTISHPVVDNRVDESDVLKEELEAEIEQNLGDAVKGAQDGKSYSKQSVRGDK